MGGLLEGVVLREGLVVGGGVVEVVGEVGDADVIAGLVLGGGPRGGVLRAVSAGRVVLAVARVAGVVRVGGLDAVVGAGEGGVERALPALGGLGVGGLVARVELELLLGEGVLGALAPDLSGVARYLERRCFRQALSWRRR